MARLIEFGDAVGLGTSDASTVSIAGLSTGWHAVSVKVGRSGPDGDPNPEIIVHLVDAAGNVIDLNAVQPGTGYGVEFKSDGNNNGQFFGEVTALDGGGFAVSYDDTSVLNDTGGKVRRSFVETFDADGTHLATIMLPVNGSATAGPEIVAIDGGGFAVSYSSSVSSGPRPQQIVEYDSSGNLMRTIALPTRSGFGDTSLSTLDDGYVAVWNDGGEVWASIVGADGTASARFRVNAGADGAQGIESGQKAVAELANGNFVVVWESGPDTQSYNTVLARVFSPTGVALTTVDLTLSADAVDPEVTALSNGGFAVAFLENVVGQGPTSTVQLYSAAGVALGEPIRLGRPLDDNGNFTAPSISELPNGDLQVVYVDATGEVETQRILVSRDGTVGADTMLGDGDADALEGLNGADVLSGLGGNDFLFGGNGADELKGGAGADQMDGGADGDRYYVDNAGDVVIESASVSGLDEVLASVSWTLGEGVAVEKLRASAGATGIELTGNERANTLFSGAGADTLRGGDGDDVYRLNGSGDRVVEEADGGRDIVYVSSSWTLQDNQEVELIRVAGATSGLALTGANLGDNIGGGSGADTITGAGGGDTLMGGGGADVFVYGALSDSRSGDGVDLIKSFTRDVDKIDLSAIQAVEGAPSDAAFTFVGFGSVFSGMKGELQQRVVGDVSYIRGDVDGDKVADFSIRVNGVASLEGDFIL